MESNFIKERVVIREQIIKKNLKDEEKAPKGTIKYISDDIINNPPESVIALEELVNERLRGDLAAISQQVDTICQIIADYLKVKAALKIFKKNPRNVRLQTNIGCNFYAQCHVDDASKVLMCIGKNLFLQLDLDDAIKMAEFKEKQWTKQLDILQQRSSGIKAYIKLALEALGRLYESDKNKSS